MKDAGGSRRGLGIRGCLPPVGPFCFIHLHTTTPTQGHGDNSAQSGDTSRIRDPSGIRKTSHRLLRSETTSPNFPASEVPAERRNSPVLGIEDRSLVIPTLEPTSQFQVPAGGHGFQQRNCSGVQARDLFDVCSHALTW